MSRRIAVAASFLFATSALAQPSPDSLRTISERGRRIAQYDFAAWHASDAVQASRPSPEQVRTYVARNDGSVWVVAFGRLIPDQSAFLVEYEARQSASRPDSFVVSARRSPRFDYGYNARAARALHTARSDFGRVGRPYNAAVLPGEGGNWSVYLYPARTRPGVWPHGGDVRYQVDADGYRILAKRRLHQAIVEFAAPAAGSGQPKAGMHAPVLDDVPEDTDVFHVLVRGPRVPQLVVTNAFVYEIASDGAVTVKGRREEILGKQ
jgi:hypothetical protein